jgi:hypothetical protein
VAEVAHRARGRDPDAARSTIPVGTPSLDDHVAATSEVRVGPREEIEVIPVGEHERERNTHAVELVGCRVDEGGAHLVLRERLHPSSLRTGPPRRAGQLAYVSLALVRARSISVAGGLRDREAQELQRVGRRRDTCAVVASRHDLRHEIAPMPCRERRHVLRLVVGGSEIPIDQPRNCGGDAIGPQHVAAGQVAMRQHITVRREPDEGIGDAASASRAVGASIATASPVARRPLLAAEGVCR